MRRCWGHESLRLLTAKCFQAPPKGAMKWLSAVPCDDTLSKARFEFRWDDQFNCLSYVQIGIWPAGPPC